MINGREGAATRFGNEVGDASDLPPVVGPVSNVRIEVVTKPALFVAGLADWQKAMSKLLEL